MRKSESDRIRAKYPDRIPVICERGTRGLLDQTPQIPNKKFLVPSKFQFGHFQQLIREHLKIPSTVTLSFLSEATKTMPPTGSLMSTIDEELRDEDGFLYIAYATENFFGHER